MAALGDVGSDAPLRFAMLSASASAPSKGSVDAAGYGLCQLVYALVKSHCMYGHAGVATVLFNNFLGLWASSMIRQVNERFDNLLAGARRIIRLLPPLGLFRGVALIRADLRSLPCVVPSVVA